MKSFSPKVLMGILLMVAAVLAVVTAVRSRDMASGGQPGDQAMAADADAMSSQASRPGPTTAPRVPLPAVDPTQGELQAEREAEKAETQKVVEAGRNKLTSQFQGQRVDPTWAPAKEQRLRSLSTTAEMSSLNAVPADLDVACRTSVCRLTATFASRAAADDWFTLYTLNVGQEMPNVSFESRVTPEGKVEVVLHGLARQ